MKFGRNLPRNQVPEWASSYINYKALKKLIKNAAEVVQHGEVADIAEFFFSLDRNLEDVDDFYNKKYGDLVRRLRLLHDQYGRAGDAVGDLDRDEAQDLMAALLELRGSFRKLQWYGEVNRRGFIKITKKLDKKIPGAATQRGYLESKVDLKPFTSNTLLTKTMNSVNEWLSWLGEVKHHEHNASPMLARPTQRASKTAFKLGPNVWESMDSEIRRDKSPALQTLLQEAAEAKDDSLKASYQRLLLELLQRSITCRARACVRMLLRYITTLNEPADMNQRNCIHRLIISMSRPKPTENGHETSTTAFDDEDHDQNYITPAAPPNLFPALGKFKEVDSIAVPGRDDEAVVFLQYLLDCLTPDQEFSLQSKDVCGRMPLHYAAQYGFVVACSLIKARMEDWGLLEPSDGKHHEYWRDSEGFTPLHLAVMGGHPVTTNALLAPRFLNENPSYRKHIVGSGEVLALATKNDSTDILQLLVDAGINLNYQDEQGETALHVASRFGHMECARVLLNGFGNQRINLELAEKTFGWTPLFIACVDGHLSIVQLLIEAGSRPHVLDTSGWSAKEHAVLRGHLAIARLIAQSPPESPSAQSENSIEASTSSTPSSLADRKSNGALNSNGTARTSIPVKTFGHRYLTDKAMILVSLGTMDMRKTTEAVTLDRIPLIDAHSTQLDTALSVVVSAANAIGEPLIVDLPVQDNISTEPIIFHTTDPTKVKLLFDIVPTYAGSKDNIVGRGVALLTSIKPSVGSKRINLEGDVTVPILAARNLEVIGNLTFNFLIITPFTHPNMSITENQTYWKSMTSTMVIGHRGMGKNKTSRTSLQLGENTIQSFIAAANLGASYVEFDVQLTKDHVPVIYHDFLVSETGIDAPVHTLTLEQFMHVNDAHTPKTSRPSSPTKMSQTSSKDAKNTDSRRTRSLSLGNRVKDERPDMSERMKHTKDFKKKGFKANSRGNFIQAPFTTLEEMFKKLPENIGFNIEMKYPMLHESQEHEMDTYGVDLNTFTDSVLSLLYTYASPSPPSLHSSSAQASKPHRPIIFSSFNPSICLLLSFKQPSIPVLFLTDAGTTPVGDVRASSLQEAIRFASRWNLLGVVSHVAPFILAPRLIRVVKSSGLVCVSYGEENDHEEVVAVQVREGIDAVIVDRVLAIRKGLTGE